MIPRLHGVGTLGGAPKQYTTQNGTALAKVSLAFNERIGNNDETLWLEAVAFGSTADFLLNYFEKGSKIEVTGRLKENRWTDGDGNQQSKMTLIIERAGFVCSKNRGAAQNSATKEQNRQKAEKKQKQDVDVDINEIPF